MGSTAYPLTSAMIDFLTTASNFIQFAVGAKFICVNRTASFDILLDDGLPESGGTPCEVLRILALFKDQTTHKFLHFDSKTVVCKLLK